MFMDTLLLARWQFAATSIYHFFFVPLTLGLSILVAIVETIYVRTENPVYKRMAKFWGKLFLINFAMGVVTGIVQEFQFGMNWSEYSRYVGDIFGAPLAIEALLAFFLESTFLGIWIFGWERLSKGLHAVAIWLVAVGANISALWILIANSFMQQPVGFAMNQAAGRAEMTDFFALLFNPNIWVQFPHVLLSGLATGAFFMMGISVFHMLRKNEEDFFKRSFQIAGIMGAFAVFFVIVNGHSQTQHMVEIQPMKIAASEALWESEEPASFSILTIGDLQEKEVFSIRIPAMLSLLAYNQLDGEVKGLNELQAEFEDQYGPGDYIPPLPIMYWSFRLMVGAGMLMLLMAGYAVFMVMGDSYLANTTGWIMAEVGRAPWAVYGLLKLEDAVSPNVTGGQLLTSLIGYVLIYGLLMVADVYLLVKYAKLGPDDANGKALEEVEPSLVPEQG
jgi:cytochrome d ubiquinol oxidase subunit I